MRTVDEISQRCPRANFRIVVGEFRVCIRCGAPDRRLSKVEDDGCQNEGWDETMVLQRVGTTTDLPQNPRCDVSFGWAYEDENDGKEFCRHSTKERQCALMIFSSKISPSAMSFVRESWSAEIRASRRVGALFGDDGLDTEDFGVGGWSVGGQKVVRDRRFWRVQRSQAVWERRGNRRRLGARRHLKPDTMFVYRARVLKMIYSQMLGKFELNFQR